MVTNSNKALEAVLIERELKLKMAWMSLLPGGRQGCPVGGINSAGERQTATSVSSSGRQTKTPELADPRLTPNRHSEALTTYCIV